MALVLLPKFASLLPETMDYLVDQGVKAIVIACNTASAAMLR
jgi:glutamate racemase